MCDVRKSVARVVLMGLAAGLFAGTPVSARAQVPGVHRETNASREARIARTIEETYSHQWEIFGGGGYLRFRSGDNTKKNNEVTWEVGADRYLNPKLAIVGDVRGSFGNAHAVINNGYPNITRPQINEYMFLGGASYRFYRQQRFAASVEGLGGASWGNFSGGSKGIPSTLLGIWPDGWKPAFSFGLAGDYNFYPNLAIRVKPTYMGTTFGGSVQNNVGFNIGLLYRFGHQ